MARISSIERKQLPDFEPMFQVLDHTMGYVPNNFLSMAHWPELLGAFGSLAATILQTGEVEGDLKQLIAMVASTANGCHYCQAHTSHSASNLGVSKEKIDAAFEFETSPLFSDRERSALRVAWHAALQPNASTDADFEALSAHFSEREMVEIVAVISLFGFLNRWSDTMKSDLEAMPLEFATSMGLADKQLAR